MLATIFVEKTIIGGRYVIEEQMAEGGMGRVFRARHATLGKVFAVKIIAPAFAEDEIARARFNQEAKLASQIAHPGIVSVVDYGEDPAVGAYMVMELVEGAPIIESGAPPMSIRRALELLAQIAEVLEHIHSHGIVHGDVKMDNVLLVDDNDGPRRHQMVKLLDFGLAQRMGTKTDRVDGTPQYVAPERIAGGPPTMATDIYALGVLAFRLLSGRYPFEGELMDMLMAHVREQPPTIAAVRGEEVDAAIETLVHRALAKDPADRHASAAAFRYEVNAVMDMLAFARKRRTGSVRPAARRDALVSVLFDKSPFPQAVVTADGTIDVANEAFAQLLGRENIEGTAVSDTSLAEHVPALLESVQTVREQGAPAEMCALVKGGEGPALELVIWLAPFTSESVHVLVRLDQL